MKKKMAKATTLRKTGFPQPVKSTPSGNKVGVPVGQLGGTTDLVTPTAGQNEKGAGTRGRASVRTGMKPKHC